MGLLPCGVVGYMRVLSYAGAAALLALSSVACQPAVSPPAEARASRPSSGSPPQLVVSGCARTTSAGPLGVGQRQGSKVALAGREASRVVYVADAEERAIHTIGLAGRMALQTSTALMGAPSSLLVLDDGRVVAALRDRNAIVVLEPTDGGLAPLCMRAVPSDPVALAATANASAIAVASGWGRALSWVDGRSFEVAASRSLAGEPRGLLVDGDRAVVGYLARSELAVVPRTAAPAARIALRMGDDRFSNQGFAVVATTVDGQRRWLAPMASIDPGEVSRTGVSGYGASWGSAAVAYVAAVEPATLAPVAVREPAGRGTSGRRRCVLPRAALADAERLLVACAGSDMVVELDARAIDPMRLPLRRWRVPAGPTAMARSGEVVWLLAEHDHALARLDRENGRVTRLALPRRTDSHIDAAYVRGRKLFHATEDPRISDDGRACASCHPDGRSDGLSWITPDGKRQSISLLGLRRRKGRFGWNGDNRRFAFHLVHTRQRLRAGAPLTTEDEAALRSYVFRMPRPTVEPRDTELVAQGARTFRSLGCASCHPGGGSDGKRHDMGTGSKLERFAFATPSLRYVSGSGPYLHDGRYLTLDGLLRAGAVGPTSSLETGERRALIAYLESLTLASERPGSSAQARWTPAGSPEAYREPTVGRRSRYALLDAQRPVEPIATDRQLVDLDALEVVETTPRPMLSSWGPRPKKLPAPQADATELRVVRQRRAARIAFRGQRLGVLHHRDWGAGGEVRPSLIASDDTLARGGSWTSCGKNARIDPVSWHAFSMNDDGSLRVERGEAWFDGPNCRLIPMWHLVARAKPIADGVYAYWSRCPTCEPRLRHRLELIRTPLAASLAANAARDDDSAWATSQGSLSLHERNSDSEELVTHQQLWSSNDGPLPKRPIVELRRSRDRLRGMVYWVTPDSFRFF